MTRAESVREPPLREMSLRRGGAAIAGELPLREMSLRGSCHCGGAASVGCLGGSCLCASRLGGRRYMYLRAAALTAQYTYTCARPGECMGPRRPDTKTLSAPFLGG